MFDPETLRTFISVAETGSFSKAAERLCKTTATIRNCWRKIPA